MRRRNLLAATAAAGFLPRIAIGLPQATRVLKFVPQADLSALDPIAASSNPTRNHAYMIYDTLYGADANLIARPQMAEGHLLEDDNRVCTITLRAGQKFHDGEPVLASDAVASLHRWMLRSTAFGDKLIGAIDELTALDDRRLRFRLKRPFPFLIEALGSPVGPAAFIMPARIAATDPYRQFFEYIGSGPYRFITDEYQAGSHAAYARFAEYIPTPEPSTGLVAGPKIANFDRVEWHTMDFATAAGALQNGEIDWFEQVPPELEALLARNRTITIEEMDTRPFLTTIRPNRSQPPFNDKRFLQALLPAISQTDFMQAVIGTNPARYVDTAGVFTPGSPFDSDAGLAPLRGPRNIELAKSMLRDAGYDGQPVRLMGPTDIMAPAAETLVAADLFRRLGINLDLALTDWGGVVQRRSNRGPIAQGGWSCSCFANSSMDFWSPATHLSLRGNGANAYFGWPDIPRLEELRDQWFDAPVLAEQQRIAREMQIVAMDELPIIPLGGYRSVSAYSRNLVDRVKGFAIFWNIRRV
jgi:peptide/nickel transport system substrate-binding protein